MQNDASESMVPSWFLLPEYIDRIVSDMTTFLPDTLKAHAKKMVLKMGSKFCLLQESIDRIRHDHIPHRVLRHMLRKMLSALLSL